MAVVLVPIELHEDERIVQIVTISDRDGTLRHANICAPVVPLSDVTWQSPHPNAAYKPSLEHRVAAMERKSGAP